MTILYFRQIVYSYEYQDRTILYRGFSDPRAWTRFWRRIPWCPRDNSHNLKKMCHPLLMRSFLITVSLSPQLVVSFLYLALNQHLTHICQLREWRHMGASRQPLRVSIPEPGSQQISSYWLSLPYRYSIPQLVSSIILGWLVSNSLFLFRYQSLDDFGNVRGGIIGLEDYI